ncbi:MAG: 16S rRNA (uracil(1498)-N(3))-methyltransferase [Alphaproteobacteria bacterium]
MGELPPIRLYVEASLAAGAEIALTPEQAHYVRNVMRRGPGDEALLFNGGDGEWRARIDTLGKRGAVLSAIERTREQRDEADLWLVFAPIKRARLAFIAEKATELGVSAIVPVLTRHTVVNKVNLARLRANAVEAAEQSGRLSVPDIHRTVTFAELLAGWPAERRIMLCDESGGGKPVAAALAAAAKRGAPPAAPWAVMIGPEGGYARDELDALGKLPFVTRVGLGQRLLRADTAAIAALACWQAVAGTWR